MIRERFGLNDHIAISQGPLANKTLAELDELEDEIDEKTLQHYRQKRLQELKEQMARNRFGRVLTISQTEYSQEVTQAGPGVYVVLHLYSP